MISKIRDSIQSAITYALVWLLLQLGKQPVIEELFAVYLREQGYTVMSDQATQITLAATGFARERLRKIGGGNKSALRDPRKSMMRVARNFERAVQQAHEGTVEAQERKRA